MRLIDADKIRYSDLSDGRVPDGVWCTWKDRIDAMPTVKAIPVEWIVDWLTRQHIPASHTCDDYYAVEMMINDWEKENERDV